MAAGREVFVHLAFASALCILSTSYAAAQNLATTPDVKWGSHIDIEGKWGNRRSLGDIGLFAPLWQNQNSLFFTDIRARYDNDDGREGNFGLGWRQMLANKWNFGAYAFYDARRSPSGNVFQQATLGLEWLHHDYDARVNFYVLFAKREYVIGGMGGAPFADVVGGNLVIVTPSGQIVERSLRGADFEIGYRLPVFPWDSMVQLRAYAGAFWFDGENLIKDISGPRGRLELSWDNLPYLNEGSRFTLGLEAQHDDVRGSNNFIMTRLRIPLSPVKTASSRLTPQERRMTERIVRDVDIVAGTAIKGGSGGGLTTTEAAINEHNNFTVSGIQQVDATAGEAALHTALATNPGGGVVVVNGAFTLTSTAHLLGNGTTLISGGAVLPLRGATSGVQVNFTAPGTAGELTTTSALTNLIFVRNNDVLKGLTASNFGAAFAPKVVNVEGTGAHVLNNTISIFSSFSTGVSVTNSDTIAISGNTINATNWTAVGLTNSTNVVVSDNIFHVTSGVGLSSFIFFVPGPNTVTFSNNSFPSGAAFGVDTENTTFGAGSSGNVAGGALFGTRCSNLSGAGNSGTVSWTDSVTCTLTP